MEIDVATDLSDELTRRVEDETWNLTFARYKLFRYPPGSHKGGEDQVYAVASRPFTVQDLPSMPYIEFAKNPMIMASIQRWWNEKFAVPRSTRFKVPTGDCCIAMVKHGLGYGIFPDHKYFMFEKVYIPCPWSLTTEPSLRARPGCCMKSPA